MDFKFEVILTNEVGANQKRWQDVWIVQHYDKDERGEFIHSNRMCSFGKYDTQAFMDACIVKELLDKAYLTGDATMTKMKYDSIGDFTTDWLFRKVHRAQLEDCSREGSIISYQKIVVACMEYKCPSLANMMRWTVDKSVSFLLCAREITIEEEIILNEIMDRLQSHPETWLYVGFNPKSIKVTDLGMDVIDLIDKDGFEPVEDVDPNEPEELEDIDVTEFDVVEELEEVEVE